MLNPNQISDNADYENRDLNRDSWLREITTNSRFEALAISMN